MSPLCEAAPSDGYRPYVILSVLPRQPQQHFLIRRTRDHHAARAATAADFAISRRVSTRRGLVRRNTRRAGGRPRGATPQPEDVFHELRRIKVFVASVILGSITMAAEGATA